MIVEQTNRIEILTLCCQFIRNTKPKRLADSEALNEAARSSMNASQPIALPPMPVRAGSSEPIQRKSSGPPLPPKRADTTMSAYDNMGIATHNEGNLLGGDDNEEHGPSSPINAASGNDPYAELEGVFGQANLDEDEGEGVSVLFCRRWKSLLSDHLLSCSLRPFLGEVEIPRRMATTITTEYNAETVT